MTKEKEVVEATPQEFGAEQLLAQAITAKADIETIERLMKLRADIKKEMAKEEFDLAISRFQGEVGQISKDKNVFDKDKKTVRYCYASLDNIQKSIKNPLTKNNLSYRFEVEIEQDFLGVYAIIRHKLGHEEKSKFKVPLGSEAFMTETQKFGARTTFAKRYALANALGLTIDEDNDAQVAEPGDDEFEKAKKQIEKCKTIEQLNQTWNDLPKKAKASKELLRIAGTVKGFILNEEKNANK